MKHDRPLARVLWVPEKPFLAVATADTDSLPGKLATVRIWDHDTGQAVARWSHFGSRLGQFDLWAHSNSLLIRASASRGLYKMMLSDQLGVSEEDRSIAARILGHGTVDKTGALVFEPAQEWAASVARQRGHWISLEGTNDRATSAEILTSFAEDVRKRLANADKQNTELQIDLTRIVRSHLKAGLYVDGLFLAEQCSETWPEDTELVWLQGHAALLGGDYKRARESYQVLRDRSVTRDRSLVLWGQGHVTFDVTVPAMVWAIEEFFRTFNESPGFPDRTIIESHVRPLFEGIVSEWEYYDPEKLLIPTDGIALYRLAARNPRSDKPLQAIAFYEPQIAQARTRLQTSEDAELRRNLAFHLYVVAALRQHAAEQASDAQQKQEIQEKATANLAEAKELMGHFDEGSLKQCDKDFLVEVDRLLVHP